MEEPRRQWNGVVGLDWTGLGTVWYGMVRDGWKVYKESGKPTQDRKTGGVGWTDERVGQYEGHDSDFGDNRGDTEQSALDGEVCCVLELCIITHLTTGSYGLATTNPPEKSERIIYASGWSAWIA